MSQKEIVSEIDEALGRLNRRVDEGMQRKQQHADQARRLKMQIDEIVQRVNQDEVGWHRWLRLRSVALEAELAIVVGFATQDADGGATDAPSLVFELVWDGRVRGVYRARQDTPPEVLLRDGIGQMGHEEVAMWILAFARRACDDYGRTKEAIIGSRELTDALVRQFLAARPTESPDVLYEEARVRANSITDRSLPSETTLLSRPR